MGLWQLGIAAGSSHAETAQAGVQVTAATVGQAMSSGRTPDTTPVLQMDVDLEHTVEPGLEPAREDLKIGQRLFLGRGGCIGCHVVAGEGGYTGPDLSRIGSIAAAPRPGMSVETYIRESIVQPEAYLVPGYSPVMPRYDDRLLSDAEIEHLVRYVTSLK